MSQSSQTDPVTVVLSVAASLSTGIVVSVLAMPKGIVEPNYGGWLFLLLPFLCGASAAIVGNWKSPLKKYAGWHLTGWWFLAVTVILLAFRWEGLICVLMASPLLIFGHAGGYYAVIGLKGLSAPRAGQISLLPFVGIAIIYSAHQIPPTETRSLTTIMEVDAPPDQIWPLLFNLPAVHAPANPFFQAGVAHPVAVRSTGNAVGAGRECVLSTGIMTEQITESIPNQRLAFRVLNTPASMVELNPFGPTNPGHLHDNYVVHQGEFTLISLPGGRTQIVGKSTYSYTVQPAGYWNLWTDALVRQIHLSVMDEIRRRVRR